MNRPSVLSLQPPRWSRRLALVLILTAGATGAVCAQTEAPQLLSTTGGDTLPALQKKAAAGDAHACMQLGLKFETGDGVKQDYAQARALYEKAAAGGVADAIYRLGKLYQDGLGVAADLPKARRLYHLAAQANVPLAQYNLGAMLVSARGGPRNFVEGLAWLILAARQGIGQDGEQRVRAHLADRPDDIAAAETRAKELRREIDARHGAKPPWPPPDVEPATAIPDIAKPEAEKPKFDLPKAEPPKFTPMPPLALPPPPLPAPPATGSPPPSDS